MFLRRRSEHQQRFIERKKREDEAPRLVALAPTLESLRIEIHESSPENPRPCPRATHVRHIMVATAPACFFVPCHDPACREGGHDATRDVLDALARQLSRFGGTKSCPGKVGLSPCARTLHYEATATYRPLSLDRAPAASDRRALR